MIALCSNVLETAAVVVFGDPSGVLSHMAEAQVYDPTRLLREQSLLATVLSVHIATTEPKLPKARPGPSGK